MCPNINLEGYLSIIAIHWKQPICQIVGYWLDGLWYMLKCNAASKNYGIEISDLEKY